METTTLDLKKKVYNAVLNTDVDVVFVDSRAQQGPLLGSKRVVLLEEVE